MTQALLYGLSGAVLIATGLAGVVMSRALIRRILGLNVLGTGIFVVIVALARRGPGIPDPVSHALVLTGIVVTVSATAVALALAVRLGNRQD